MTLSLYNHIWLTDHISTRETGAIDNYFTKYTSWIKTKTTETSVIKYEITFLLWAVNTNPLIRKRVSSQDRSWKHNLLC